MRSRIFVAVGSSLVTSVLPPAVAVAQPDRRGRYEVKDLRVVSGPSPFSAGCPGARFDDKTIAGHELEPAVAVNPANPRNIIATWKQDVGSANQTRADLVGFSLDGGQTWSRRTIPALTVCTGGTADAGSDPWVSAGGDGTVYFGGLAASLSTDPPTTAVVASRSRDGGRTWPAPATVVPPLAGNEQSAITGSPRPAGHACPAGVQQERDPLQPPRPPPASAMSAHTAATRPTTSAARILPSTAIDDPDAAREVIVG